jgi:hypothetical protein
VLKVRARSERHSKTTFLPGLGFCRIGKNILYEYLSVAACDGVTKLLLAVFEKARELGRACKVQRRDVLADSLKLLGKRL